jgi:hypothetical protein
VQKWHISTRLQGVESQKTVIFTVHHVCRPYVQDASVYHTYLLLIFMKYS